MPRTNFASEEERRDYERTRKEKYKAKLTPEQNDARLERQRESQRKCREGIKTDPVKHAEYLEKDRLAQQKKRADNRDRYLRYEKVRRERDKDAYLARYREAQRKRRAADPEKHRTEKREQARLKRRRILANYAYSDACEICGFKFNESEKSCKAQWDHDHLLEDRGVPKKLQFRGWLCMPCNQVLGLAEKGLSGWASPAEALSRLDAIKAYLVKHYERAEKILNEQSAA